jgi:HEAT repeat protein
MKIRRVLTLFPFLVLVRLAGGADTAGKAAEEISALIPALAGSSLPEAERAYAALERLSFQAGRPGAEAERKALAEAISQKLTPDVPLAARMYLVQSLEKLGRGEAIPALGKLLSPQNDPALQDAARRALEANPHINAKKELRGALKHAQGKLKVAIIRSLGVRRDFLASVDLMEAAQDDDPQVKLAGIEALSLVGDVSAVPVVESALEKLKGADLAALTRAYLRLADSLVKNKERGAARRIYQRAMGMGPAARSAALLGFARAGLQTETNRILEATADPDPRVQGSALEAAAILPGEGMTKALLGKLDGTKDPAARASLLDVLSRRADKEAVGRVAEAAKDEPDPRSRAHALRLLGEAAQGKESRKTLDGKEVGTLDGKELASVLLPALDSGGEPAVAAEEVLSKLPGAAVTESLVSAGTGAPPKKLAALMRILGARRDPKGIDAVKARSKDPSLEVRVAALKSLGSLGDPSTASLLLDAIRSGGGAERDAAVTALARLPGDEAGKAVLAALQGEKGAVRAALLRVLGARRVEGGLEILKAAVAESDPEVCRAAIEGLARADDPSALSVLLEAAEHGSGEVQEAALKGSLRRAEAMAREKSGEALKIYIKALDIATKDDDLRVALQGVAELGEADRPEKTLEKILAFLKPGKLQRDAGRAALRLAERLPEEKQPSAKEIYQRILALDPDEATASQCVRRLRRLGVKMDSARREGFVTHWWILAPLPNPDGGLWERSLSPEKEVELTAEVPVDGKTYRWRHYQTPSPRGLVELDEAGYPASNAGAYLYAEVTLPEDREALFKLGSDDKIAAWLNGKKIHSNPVNRGLSPDQDTVEVKLQKGVNRILLKVLNDGSAWGACLRITDRSGKPMEVGQREA